ncbi:MAG: prepilin-type N-terminal cleavage/methylation domain-containing protein [Acidobacteriota bacterium]
MKLFKTKNQVKGQDPEKDPKVDKGVSLLEALAAMTILLVVILGLAPLLDVSTRTTEINQREIEVLNASRQKLEEIHQIMSYDSVGIIVATSGDTSGAAYFETDPIYAGSTFDSEDFLLSDSIPMTFGTATRTVTVEAVDDAADNTGTNDWDQIFDPNTGTILDYKLVRVVTTTLEPVTDRVLQGEVVSILRGFLDSEIDGSTGEDSGAGSDPGKKGTKDPAKAKKGTDGTGHDSGEGAGKGRAGKSGGTDE